VTEDKELQERFEKHMRWNPRLNPYRECTFFLRDREDSALETALGWCPETFTVAHARRGNAEARSNLERVWGRLSERLEKVGSVEEGLAVSDAIHIVREKEIEFGGLDPCGLVMWVLPSWNRGLKSQLRVDELVGMPDLEFRRRLLAWSDRPSRIAYPPDDYEHDGPSTAFSTCP
jgi:hypothetical protein